MKTIYLNMRGPYGVETVDSFAQGQDSPQAWREFMAYVREMVREYHLSGQNVYTSSRPAKDWANK